jgi:hypothetical protein
MSFWKNCAGLGNQSCYVVLVKGALTWENHKGSGFLNGKQMGSRWGAVGKGWRWGDQFTSNLGSGWMDIIAARRVPSK